MTAGAEKSLGRIFPLVVVGASVANNFAYSAIQVFVGRGFDRILALQ